MKNTPSELKICRHIVLPETWDKKPLIVLLLFEKRGNQFSYPHGWLQGTRTANFHRRGIWYDEDKIASDLIVAAVRRDMTAKVNNGVSIYYGVGVGYPPQQILILGYIYVVKNILQKWR